MSNVDMERILRTLKNKQTRQEDALSETLSHIKLIEEKIVEEAKQKVLAMEAANTPPNEDKKKK